MKILPCLLKLFDRKKAAFLPFSKKGFERYTQKMRCKFGIYPTVLRFRIIKKLAVRQKIYIIFKFKVGACVYEKFSYDGQ